MGQFRSDRTVTGLDLLSRSADPRWLWFSEEQATGPKSYQEGFHAEAESTGLCGSVIVKSGGNKSMWVGESSNKRSDFEILMHVWAHLFWEIEAAQFSVEARCN